MKTLIFTNQKGGTGKTTSALSAGAGLARKGYKVLLADTDPQGHTTKAAGVAVDAEDITTYEVLKGAAKTADAIRVTAGGYDVLPTDIRQSGAEIELASADGRNYILAAALNDVKDRYDYVIIDSPPSLGVITLMGLTAADGVIITLKADYLALDGVAQLKDTLDIVRRRLNPRLDITGVLLTFYRGYNLHKAVAAQAEEGFPGKIFKTRISDAVALAEAPAAGCDIFRYRPDSNAAKQYEALTEEIIERTKA